MGVISLHQYPYDNINKSDFIRAEKILAK